MGYTIRNAQDAEAAAADWMRKHGYPDARVTRAGPDAGVDVRSESAVAQVKAQAVTVGRPVIQQTAGIAQHESKQALVFSLGGYTREAAAWADAADVALFEFNYEGEVTPANHLGQAIARATAPVSRISENRFVSVVKSGLEIVWLLAVGLWSGAAYFSAAVLLLIPVVTFPLSLQLFKISFFVLWPFDKEVIPTANASRIGTALANLLWLVVGIWISLWHLLSAAVFALTVVGLPIAASDLKLARLALSPFGKRVVRYGAPPPISKS